MGFKCGIVGLPNVGKSTLFNALTQTATAAAENYPFCTIEPNIGQVPVPDPRLHEIARIAKSAKTIETQLMFVDIAGLVRGASKGEGLGNKFLGNIREVDAIIHILRCFEDSDVTHVEGKIDPVSDAETVETELMLSDLESLERRKEGFIKRARGNDKEAVAALPIVEAILTLLAAGKPGRLYTPKDNDERRFVKRLHLLTTKPILYVANVEEDVAATGNAYSESVMQMASVSIPARSVRRLSHLWHEFLPLPRSIRDPQITRHPGHINVTISRNNSVLHACAPLMKKMHAKASVVWPGFAPRGHPSMLARRCQRGGVRGRRKKSTGLGLRVRCIGGGARRRIKDGMLLVEVVEV